ncbi:MAG: hypothetical protein LBH58_10390, partial [Tannerellaceae bacterium]|nr:hypothetical protein [Tannerellaceae bacterium]
MKKYRVRFSMFNSRLWRTSVMCVVCGMSLLFMACSEETPIPPPSGGGEKPKDDDIGTLTLSIRFPGENLSTRSLTDDQERNIKDLRIFVFESAGASDDQPNDKFLYEVENVPTPQGTGDEKTVEITLRKMTQGQRLVLVADLPSTITLKPSVGDKMGDIFNPLKIDANLWLKSSTNDYPAFPMWGQMRSFVTINTGPGVPPPPTKLEVNMFRTLAKVDLGVDMDNPSSQLANDFKINAVYACNISGASYLVPHVDYVKGSGIEAERIEKIRPETTRIARFEYPMATPFRELKGTVYIPESDIAGNPAGNKPAFIVIKATYKGVANRFYRIDFAKEGDFIPVIRNHAYRFNIKAVMSNGYASLAEAESAAPTGLDNDIVIEGVNDVINDIVYNGDDMLGVDVSEVLFDWDKTLLGKFFRLNNNEFTLKLFTTYSTWSASIDGAAPSWLRLIKGSSGEVTALSNQPQTPGQLSGFTILIKEENVTGRERSATITLKSGMLEKKIKVRQSGGANSYVVRFEVGDMSTVTFRIPLAFAYEAITAATGTTPIFDMTKLAAKVWWYETAASKPVTFAARINGNCIEVGATPAGSKIGGNAVIALTDGNGIGMVGGKDPAKVLWSFHVWAMERTDDIDTFYHNTNREYMLRTVLGKHKDNNGMFYQWGRKDPFPQYTTQASPRFVRA